MQAGPMNYRVTFRRRAVAADAAARIRGGFVDLFTVWAGLNQNPGQKIPEGGAASDVQNGMLFVRDSPQIRTLTAQDRVDIGGVDHAILSVSMPVRRSGSIGISVSRRLGG